MPERRIGAEKFNVNNFVKKKTTNETSVYCEKTGSYVAAKRPVFSEAETVKRKNKTSGERIKANKPGIDPDNNWIHHRFDQKYNRRGFADHYMSDLKTRTPIMGVASSVWPHLGTR